MPYHPIPYSRVNLTPKVLPYTQRILSPLSVLRLPTATRYQAVFIDASAVKASSRRTWYHNITPSSSLIPEEQRGLMPGFPASVGFYWDAWSKLDSVAVG
jgi:hypothetical protein